MIKKIRKYLKVWWIFASNSFQTQLVMKWAVAFFLLGKLLRFLIFILFILVLLNSTKALAGYSLHQVMLFYLSFNLIDTLVQTVFREVYRFRPAVVNGTFDFYLIKPFSPLFRSLAAGPDLIDLSLLIPLVGAIIYLLGVLGITSFSSIFTFVLLLAMGFIIGLAFHILVLSLAIITTEIDHAIMLYRDITGMGRFPIDIYSEPLRGFLTFVVPIGIMMSFPVKSLIGSLSIFHIFYAICFTLIFLYFSLKVWGYSLKKYSSASS